MRNTRCSSNTRPMLSLIACADSSEWPIGFSSTIRESGPARPDIARLVAMLVNRLGEVAR